MADRAMEALRAMVEQHCIAKDRGYDSWAITANAEAMHVLAEAGLFVIEAEVGRRVIGRFVEQEASRG